MRRAKLGAAAILVTAIASPAFATDLPKLNWPLAFAPPAGGWSGLYAGLNAGVVGTLDSGDPYCVNPAGFVNGIGCSFQADRPLFSRPYGLIGGGQIGYNWQFHQYIAGLEADFQGTTANGTNTLSLISFASGFPDQDQVSSKLDYLGTVRGRLGVAVLDPLMLYATGGLAYGGGHVSSAFSGPSLAAPAVLYPAAASYTRVGWTLGGGFEYAIAPHWTAKLEALYYDLGYATTAGAQVIGGPTGFTEGKTFSLNGVIGRFGVNYKFDWLAPPTPVGGAGPVAIADLQTTGGPLAFMPSPPPHWSWTGCHVGANLGYGWQRNHAYDPGIPFDAGTDTGSGIVGGGQLGCDYQAGTLVVGVQGDLDGSAVTGNHLYPFIPTKTLGFGTDWFATQTVRIGYSALPNALLYVKGGVAEARLSYTDADPTVPYFGSAGLVRVGGTVGGGVEYAFAPDWSVFAEYDYTAFDSHNTTLSYALPIPITALYTYNETQNLQRLLVGVNYKFNLLAPLLFAAGH